MKKILVVLMMLVPMSVSAGSFDTALSDAWTSISASSNFHLLDNASVDVFKNLNKHEYYAGTSTYLYKYWYFSANFIAVKPLADSSNVMPGAGIKFHLGELLYSIPAVKSAVDYVGKETLIDSMTIGVGYSRFFATGENVPMVYGGLIKKF
jgi:hypothetical protein